MYSPGMGHMGYGDLDAYTVSGSMCSMHMLPLTVLRRMCPRRLLACCQQPSGTHMPIELLLVTRLTSMLRVGLDWIRTVYRHKSTMLSLRVLPSDQLLVGIGDRESVR